MITGWQCQACGQLWPCDAGTVVGFLRTMLLVPVLGWHTYISCPVPKRVRHRPCRCADCLARYGWPPVLPSHLPPLPTNAIHYGGTTGRSDGLCTACRYGMEHPAHGKVDFQTQRPRRVESER